MKIKINKYCLFIAVIIFFNLQGFYLLDANVFHTDDLSVVLELLFIFFELKGREKSTGKKYFSLLMLIPIVLVLSSSFAAYISYGQPLWYGIRAQRTWLMAMLMYFPLVNLLKSKRISSTDLTRTLNIMVWFYMILIVLQYVVGTRLMFFHVGYNFRYNSIRLYVSTYLIVLNYFIHLKKILTAIHFRFTDTLVLIFTLYIHFFVVKSRMGLIAIIISTLFAIVSTRFSIKKLIATSIAVLSMIAFVMTSYGHVVMNSIFGEEAQDAGTQIREAGREFYIQQVTSSKLSMMIGKGYANLDWQPTLKATHYLDGIYYNDNGIIGLAYYYGLIFIVWMIFIHIKTMKLSWRYGKEYFWFLLCGLVGSYTLFPYCYVNDISFALALAIIDNNNEKN